MLYYYNTALELGLKETTSVAGSNTLIAVGGDDIFPDDGA